MKQRLLITLLVTLFILSQATAQKQTANVLNAFKGNLVNEELQMTFHIDFLGESVTVPGQTIFGNLPGYIGVKYDSRIWLITSAKRVNDKTYKLSIINDYGSEDLTATLTLSTDSTYTFKQKDGSPIKFAKEKKWQKQPKSFVLRKK